MNRYCVVVFPIQSFNLLFHSSEETYGSVDRVEGGDYGLFLLGGLTRVMVLLNLTDGGCMLALFVWWFHILFLYGVEVERLVMCLVRLILKRRSTYCGLQRISLWCWLN